MKTFSLNWADCEEDEYEQVVDTLLNDTTYSQQVENYVVDEKHDLPENQELNDPIILFSDACDYDNPNYRTVVFSKKELLKEVHTKKSIYKWFHGYVPNNKSIIYPVHRYDHQLKTKYAEQSYISFIENYIRQCDPNVYRKYITKEPEKALKVKKDKKKKEKPLVPANVFDLLR